MGIQAANLTARSHMGWFIVPALLIVIGALFLGDSLLFGTPSSSIKVFIGTFLAVIGLAWVFYFVFVKKHGGT
jgi:EamA domain-containing membrane protein RarD